MVELSELARVRFATNRTEPVQTAWTGPASIRDRLGTVGKAAVQRRGTLPHRIRRSYRARAPITPLSPAALRVRR